MKKIQNTIIVLAFTLGIIGSVNSQAFVKVGGKALDIAMSPKDGSIFVVNASRNVKKYNSRTKKFQVFGTQAKNAKSIAVHPNGSVYMVSTSNEAFIDVKGKWIKIPGLKIDEIDIDKSGNVRATDLAGKLYKLTGGKWQPISNVNFNTSGFNQVVARDSRILFARFKDNAFKTFNGSIWKTLNGKPLKITVDDKTGKVYAVGRNKGIYQWFDNTQKWVLIKNTRKGLKDVAVHNGKIWAIGLDKSIYYYDKSSQTASANSDFTGTYRVFINKIGSSKGKKIYGVMGVYLKTNIKSGLVPIAPLHRKPNRFWDYPKSSLKTANGPGLKVDKYLNSRGENDTWEGSIDIDKVREFKLMGEAAKGNPLLDFEININSEMIGKDWGGWNRCKVPLKEIQFGKEYYIYHPQSINTISFKVEKL